MATVAPGAPKETGGSIGDSALLGPFTSVGKILVFGGGVLGQTPLMLARYVGEVWWYAAFLAIGSTPVVLVLVAFTGLPCSVEPYYPLSHIGTHRLVRVLHALQPMPHIPPLL